MRVITPECCEPVQEKRTVILQFRGQDIYGAGPEGQVGKKPRWIIIGQHPATDTPTCEDASFCPHCGTNLPEIKLRNPVMLKKSIRRVIDGGYYCDTCKERLESCTCLPPEFAWEIGD